MAAVILMLALALGGCVGMELKEYPVVARVDGADLTDLELQEEMNRLVPRKFHGSVAPEVRATYRPAALEGIIDKELLYREGLRLGLDVEADELDRKLKEFKTSVGKKQYREFLEHYGISEGQYREMIRKQDVIDRVIAQEVELKGEVSDEEARAYYERNRESYKRPEAWRVSHILIEVAANAPDEQRQAMRERALKVHAEATTGGVEFGKLAWDYSDDPYRYVHGDLGLMHQGRLMPEIEAVVRGLEVGQVSDVIETIYGYHLVKLTERIAPTQLAYEEVEKEIVGRLKDVKVEHMRENLMGRLRGGAEIWRAGQDGDQEKAK